MNHPFAIRHQYDRDEMLSFVGSKQGQSGILWGPLQPGVVICTSGGKHGEKAGYSDVQNPDGTWDYFGQGSNGDQNPDKAANKILLDGNRSVLLFSTRQPTAAEVKSRGHHRKRYQFEGSYCVQCWEFSSPSTGHRNGDKLLKIRLMPTSDDDTGRYSLSSNGLTKLPEGLVELRRLAAKHSTTPEKGFATSTKEYFQRSAALKKYALARADGVCELCVNKAPFVTPKGSPFLEVHHILRLADDGPDLPKNVAAVCPNCHRAAHHSTDSIRIREALIKRVAAIETRLAMR